MLRMSLHLSAVWPRSSDLNRHWPGVIPSEREITILTLLHVYVGHARGTCRNAKHARSCGAPGSAPRERGDPEWSGYAASLRNRQSKAPLKRDKRLAVPGFSPPCELVFGQRFAGEFLFCIGR